MILKDISLYLNPVEFKTFEQTHGDFEFRSRYVCNFIRRRIAKLKFNAIGFGSIAIQGCLTPVDASPIEGERVAVATVRFEHERYPLLKPTECHEFFIGMLVDGLEKCARFHRIPLSAMLSSIEEFRAFEYRNEWIHKKTTFKSIGLHAVLKCSMDMDKFALRLVIERNGSIIFEEQILTTEPDETIFAYQFKDVTIQGDALIVRSKFDKPMFSLKLDALTERK